jgi:hypothetical protein
MSLTLEQLTFLLTLINSTVLTLLFIFVKFGIEKKLKKYEYRLGDASELNRKMHDRLVESEGYIENLEPIPKGTISRLQMNASRLEKYDSSISKNVDELIKTWGEAFFSATSGAVDISVAQEKKKNCLNIIREIKAKVDKIVQ